MTVILPLSQRISTIPSCWTVTHGVGMELIAVGRERCAFRWPAVVGNAIYIINRSGHENALTLPGDLAYRPLEKTNMWQNGLKYGILYPKSGASTHAGPATPGHDVVCPVPVSASQGPLSTPEILEYLLQFIPARELVTLTIVCIGWTKWAMEALCNFWLDYHIYELPVLASELVEGDQQLYWSNLELNEEYQVVRLREGSQLQLASDQKRLPAPQKVQELMQVLRKTPPYQSDVLCRPRVLGSS